VCPSVSQYQGCAFSYMYIILLAIIWKSLRLTGKLGVLLHAALTNSKVHAHNLGRDDRLRQAVHHPTLEGMRPERRDNGVLLANELHGKGNILIRGGDHETLTHLGQLGGHVKGNLALNGDALASILGIESTRERNDVGLGCRVLRQERERVHG